MTRRDYCDQCGGMVEDSDPICVCGASYHYNCHTLDDAHTRLYLIFAKYLNNGRECNFTVKELKSFAEDIVEDEIEDIEEAKELLIPLIEKCKHYADKDILMNEDISAFYVILDIVCDYFNWDYFHCMNCKEKEVLQSRIKYLENELNSLKK